MIHLEFNRIMSHLVWSGPRWSTLTISPLFYTFRGADRVLDLFEMKQAGIAAQLFR